MSKERVVDRFFWDDPDSARLTRDERLLMVGCWTKLADDEGRFLADPRFVRKEIFGYDQDLNISEISDMLKKICATFRSWTLYSCGDHQYIQIDKSKWQLWQGIRYVVHSKLPEAPVEPNGLRFQSQGEPVDKIPVSDRQEAITEISVKLQETSETFGSRDARAVGLGSVGLGRVGKTISASNGDAAGGEQLNLLPVTANGRISTAWWDANFETWWKGYWNKHDKVGAREKFETAVRKLSRNKHVGIEEAVVLIGQLRDQDRERFSETQEWDWRKKLHACRWLSKARWEDEPAPSMDEEIDRILTEHQNAERR